MTRTRFGSERDRTLVGRLCLFLANAMVIAALGVSAIGRAAAADEGAAFIGRASCATATCHGGIAGQGPAWHASAAVWEAVDPHAHAGQVLLNPLSRRIVSALDPESQHSEAALARTLQERCASCHAPALTRWQVPNEKDGKWPLTALHAPLSAGVACEDCHGRASVWQPQHTSKNWTGAERFHPQTGMLDTESPLQRTDICTQCHVGSYTAGGSVRDMNHDMVAAGHPALHFDMLKHHHRLPVHWDDQREALGALKPVELARAAEALRSRVLLAALRLSASRQAAGATAPQPELSEFDCAACHHALQLESFRQARSSPGAPLWQPWYTAALPLELPREELRMDRSDLAERLRALEKPLEQRAQSLRDDQAAHDPAKHFSALLEGANVDARFDYCTAPAWVDQLELAGRSLFQDEQYAALSNFENRLFAFRRDVLGYGASTERNGRSANPQAPSPLELLMPRPWTLSEVERLRRDLARGLNLQENGPGR